MDCFECDDDKCAMKTGKHAGVQPCFYCQRASEEEISDACLICIAGHMCCFIEREEDTV